MAQAVGVDITSIERIGGLVERRPKFAERCFTAAERAECQGHPERWAARWAAKEAVRKLAGFNGLPLPAPLDIEIRKLDGGAPIARVRGWAAPVSISLTHDAGMAAAVAILPDRRVSPYFPPPPALKLPDRPHSANKGTF